MSNPQHKPPADVAYERYVAYCRRMCAPVMRRDDWNRFQEWLVEEELRTEKKNALD